VSRPQQPSYEELVARVVVQDQVIAELRALVEALQAEVAALRRQVDRDSSNSSQPPSRDGPAAEPSAAARGRSGRRPGGQKGRRGTGLERVATPDRVTAVEPAGCGGCGAGLDEAAGQIASTVQVFDIPTIALSVTEYQMMRRTCTGCGAATTAAPPAGVTGGPACYGPNVVAATTLLAASDVIGIERAAELMAGLLASPVSTGFVSRCLARLEQRLVSAGFEDSVKDGLRAAAVIGTDETPANVAEPGNHHVYTVRTMRSHTRGAAAGPSRDLVWYGAADNRGHAAIDAFGLLEDHTGVLVRDDYGGYTKFDAHLTGVQQCCSHIFRHLADVHDIDADQHAWTDQAARALKAAGVAVNAARAPDPATATPDADLFARLRRECDGLVCA
jgi:transposase/uncharacterized coiled-coil protein SlyX